MPRLWRSILEDKRTHGSAVGYPLGAPPALASWYRYPASPPTKKKKGSGYVAHGVLTICGVAKDVDLPFECLRWDRSQVLLLLLRIDNLMFLFSQPPSEQANAQTGLVQ